MQTKTPKLILCLLKDIYANPSNHLRLISNEAKYVANIESDLSTKFDIGLRYRLHAGRRHIPTVSLPARLEAAALQIINKHNCHQFREDVNEMFKKVISHQLPAEEEEVELKALEIKEKIALKDGNNEKSLTKSEWIEVQEDRKQELNKRLKDSLINHQSIKYDNYSCVAYMAARLPANYAALLSIFNGIQKDVPDFKPRTLFDFGSGVGTTMWAAEDVWPKAFDEYFCVDISNSMNELSRLLLQSGKENKKPVFDPVFYRQYLPVSNTIKYDLVVSAFSLLDILDAKNRVHVIENLWHKTQGLLVIVEHGSRAGFAAVLEARNLILQLSGHKITAHIKTNIERTEPTTKRTVTDATIVSPCSHDLTCPRQSSKGPVLCNFEVPHNPLRFGQKNAVIRKERFSYVVIQKGSQQPEVKHWPRIVQPVLTGHHRATCRFCCSDGKLKEIIITKAKHQKHTYRCAKISRWGDKFPADIQPIHNINDSTSQ